MRVPGGLRLSLVLLATVLIVASAGKAVAQRGGGGRGGGMPGGQFPGGPGGYGGGMSNPHDTRDGSGNIPSEQGGGGARWGLQIGPPGRWWDDKHFVKSLHLRPDQQRRMDGIFEQSRPTLLKRYEALQKEQQQMETLTRARTLDENALFTQIDRVEQARADLAKATTHMFYQLRGEMDADQIAKIEQ